MDDESSDGAPLHPLASEAGRRMLRDLQDAASAAEWHETVARIFRYLFVVAAEARRLSDPRLLVWMERIEAAIAAGPPGGKRRPGIVQARRDADFVRSMCGERPTRADAVRMLMFDELRGPKAGLMDTQVARQRARDNAAKRADAAARVGLKMDRRPKRK